GILLSGWDRRGSRQTRSPRRSRGGTPALDRRRHVLLVCRPGFFLRVRENWLHFFPRQPDERGETPGFWPRPCPTLAYSLATEVVMTSPRMPPGVAGRRRLVSPPQRRGEVGLASQSRPCPDSHERE